jgi:gamma-glutamyltranspeptidase/glutathione hydrolase
MTRRVFLVLLAFVFSSLTVHGGSAPVRAKRGLVITQSDIASQIGFQVIRDGGNAVDAAVATALAMAVTHPTAGNIGGGGFLVFRSATGDATTFDFREAAPAGSNPEMWLVNGKYDSQVHHNSHRAVGVPGTVAGLHLAWKTYGSKPWKDLVAPAVKLARDGFELTDGLARSLERTLQRIADQGPAGFYDGETAALLEKEMKANGGLITRDDLKNYQAKQRAPIKGTYRGHDIIGMAPPSSGGIAVQMALNILEGYDLKANGAGSAQNIHYMAEAMRRAFADRARHLGDPDFVRDMPIDRLISKEYATALRKTINPSQASTSSPTTFTWTAESDETTHISIVDAQRNAVAMTYTLEAGYGSKIVVPGAGFLLNNEMGDFNAGPGLTNDTGLIGTEPNLARPGKRMLSSMSPTIIAKDGKLFMVTGTPGGRTIINTVLGSIVNVIDYGMNAQEAVDAGRIHHQWLPDRLDYEEIGFSPDTIALLKKMGHAVRQGGNQGACQVIVFNQQDDMLEGGLDRRSADGGAAGK